MGKFDYSMPTKVIHGEGCVRERGDELVLGRKALIVTGKSSAKASGALDDVLAVLSVEYELFDEVENNPSLETVARGGKIAREGGFDFIIAIGGGSPLDAAKVIAVLAVNDVDPLSLYIDGWENSPLPIAAIPTTAGTGSEVTQYAVMTIKEQETKRGLGGPDLFPSVSFLDARYTASLPLDITVDTAVDALSHLVEGYLARKANTISDGLAAAGIRLWGTCRDALVKGEVDLGIRENLLLASTLGGMTIAQTSTTLVHALGYPLTYFHGLPHGRANGILMSEYLRYMAGPAEDRVQDILTFLGMDSIDEFAALMDELFDGLIADFDISDADISKYAERAAITKNVANSRGNLTADALSGILSRSVDK